MPPKKDLFFDQSKFETMVEPFTVRLDRIRGNTRQNTELPVKQGFPAGQGWSREEVSKLEQAAVEQAGYGFYEAQVTDAAGTTMLWRFNQSAAPDVTQPQPQLVMAPAPAPQQQQQPVRTPLAAPAPVYAAPAPAPMAYFPQAPQPQPQAWPPMPWQQQQSAWPSPPTPFWGQSHQGNGHGNNEDRLRLLETQLLADRHKMDVERLQMQHERQITELRDEMRRMAESQVVQVPQRASESPEYTMLKQQLAEAKAQSERDRQEAQHREELRALGDRMEKQIEAIKSQQAQSPIVEFMKESSRMQAETMRENSRVQQAQTDKMAAMLVNPVQLAQLMSEKDTSHDKLFKTFDGIVGMYQRAHQDLQGGEAPWQTILRDGIANAKDIADRWMTTKRDAAIGESRSKASIAQAAAQAQAAANAPQQALAGPAPVVVAPPQAKAPTDEELFGPIFREVKALRKGVTEGNLTSQQAAAAILTGIGEVARAQQAGTQIVVPAFALFEQGRFADLVDVLLPKALPEFKQEVARYFTEEFTQGEDAGDEEETEEANGEPAVASA